MNVNYEPVSMREVSPSKLEKSGLHPLRKAVGVLGLALVMTSCSPDIGFDNQDLSRFNQAKPPAGSFNYDQNSLNSVDNGLTVKDVLLAATIAGGALFLSATRR